MSFVIESSAFGEDQPIPRRHTGDGEDLSPPLAWRGVPAAARAWRSLWMTPMLPPASRGCTG